MRNLTRFTLMLGTLTAALLTTASFAEARSPIRDCGSAAGDNAAATTGGAYALTAQGTTCATARAVAKVVPGRKACRPAAGGCAVRGYTCLTGQAGKELFLVHCESANQTRFIRFEYGS